jgi:methyl-accepting chemotaxis protein
MAKISPLNSLSGRLMLVGVFPAILTIAAIVVLAGIEGYRTARAAEERLLVADVTGAAAELAVRSDRWNAIAQTIAASQINGMFGHRKDTVDFLKAANAVSKLNLSTFVAYEPNADGQDAESLKSGKVPAEAMDSSGRFLPVWYDVMQAAARAGESRLKPITGTESLPFYLAPKAEFAKSGAQTPTVTEPYTRDGEMIVSHVSPIIIQGKFMGVAGVDRSLNVLTQIALAIKARSRADVFILSSQGVFIAATTDAAGGEGALKDRPIAETPFAQIASRWQMVGGDAAVRVFDAEDPVLGAECIYANARVSVGGWTIVARRPKDDVMRAANTAVMRKITIGTAAIVLVGGLLFLVTRGISKRVRIAAAAADRIARGDLTEQVSDSTNTDETGALMRSMRTMDANLNSLVGNVKQAGIRLNSTATEIAATSKQQESATGTFGAASNQIAAAVKEISATSQDLVRTMESVNRMAEETAHLAGTGRAGLQGMESVMADLDAGTRSIADKLGEINDRSQKITAVITTIAKVADQTNILSINAAIEAEKAGEFGAGFLVIAREIRRLADQTASATLDIEQMVQQMQSAVSSGVMEMDRFSDQVRRGVRDVATAGTQLTEIINRVNSSTDSFKQVNESMQSQSEGAHQISDAMTSLVGTAKQTSQSAQEFGRAAADLQSAIATLREAVSQFKLRD